jgi:hypothetical protein
MDTESALVDDGACLIFGWVVISGAIEDGIHEDEGGSKEHES